MTTFLAGLICGTIATLTAVWLWCCLAVSARCDRQAETRAARDAYQRDQAWLDEREREYRYRRECAERMAARTTMGVTAGEADTDDNAA